MEEQVMKPQHSTWKWALGILAGVIVLALLMGLLLFRINRFTLRVIPAGASEITLEYGDEFRDQGADVLFGGSLFLRQGITPDAQILTEGYVDEDTLGTYEIRYTSEYLWWEAAAVRTVHVVDTVAPEITLTADEDYFTPVGEKYQEEGYAAADNYDGDLTAQVRRWEEAGYVFYEVQDSSGNISGTYREIIYKDLIPPQITLLGEQTVYIYTGSTYSDAGATASDNYDGDLTAKVSIQGQVDAYRSGSYQLVYTVTDSYGNAAEAVRNVEVVPRPQPADKRPGGKVIYLTFDDGPGPYTEQLLAVLEKYNVKATFFVINTDYIHLLPQITAAGHSIGIHSVTHDYSSIYSSTEAYFNDLYGMQTIIANKTGVSTTLMRFPGGSSNTISAFNPGIMTTLTQSVQDAGFQYFDWNVDSNDAGGARTSEQVFQNVISGIQGKNTAIVLQHDIKGFSVEAVEKIIIWGLENGYTFLALEPGSPTAHHGVNN